MSAVDASDTVFWQERLGRFSPGDKIRIAVYADDYAGNVSLTNLIDVTVTTNRETVDITPPLLSVTSPKDGGIYSNGTITIKGSALDAAGFGKNGVYLSVDGGEEIRIGTTSFGVERILTDGSHTVTVQAMDAAGNTSVEKKLTFTVDSSLSSTPVLNLLSPTEGETYSGAVPIRGSASDTNGFGTNGVYLRIDDGDFERIGGEAFDTERELSVGEHTVTIKAVDALGNATPEYDRTFAVTVAFTLDWDAEPVAETAGTNGFTLTAQLNEPGTVYYAAYDSADVDPDSDEVIETGAVLIDGYALISGDEISAGKSLIVFVVGADESGRAMDEPFRIELELEADEVIEETVSGVTNESADD